METLALQARLAPTPEDAARQRRRTRLWDTHRSRVGEAVLSAALRADAAMEAAFTVNSVLADKLGLSGVSLAVDEFESNVMTVLRAEIAHVLSECSVLPRDQVRELTRRVVSRLVPTRDDVATTQTRGSGRIDESALQRIIDRDIKGARR